MFEENKGQPFPRLHLKDYWAVVLKRRWVGLIFFALVLLVVGFRTFNETRIYRARVQVLIQKSHLSLLSPLEYYTGDLINQEILQTQYKIIESQSLALRVIRKLNLTSNPEFVPANRTTKQAASEESGRLASPPDGHLFPVSSADAGLEGLLDRISAPLPVNPVFQVPEADDRQEVGGLYRKQVLGNLVSPMNPRTFSRSDSLGATQEAGNYGREGGPVYRGLIQADSDRDARRISLDLPLLSSEILLRQTATPLPEEIPPEKSFSPKASAPASRPSSTFETIDCSPLEEEVIGQFLPRLKVEPIRNSYLVNIGFEARDPQLAARIANAVAAAYIDWNVGLKNKMQQTSASFLEDQVKDQKAKLEESEKALQAYRAQYGMVLIGPQGQRGAGKEESAAVHRYRHLNSLVVEAQNKRIEAETRYNEAKILLNNPSRMEAIPEVIRNPLVEQIKKEEVELLTRRAELAEKYGEMHPTMIGLGQKINDLTKKKIKEIGNIVNSLKSQYDHALAQERSLKMAAENSRIETLNQDKIAIQYQVLQQEAEINRTLYDLLLKRYKEANISEDNQGINLQVVDPAKAPKSPVRPNIPKTMATALLIGLVGGLGLIFLLEYLDNTVKTPEDVQRFFDLTYLGPIPRYEIQPAEPRGGLVVLETPRSPAAEAFRGLRTNLFFSFPEQGPKVILITSPTTGDGKTLTTSNLAVAMAQGANRVLILDGDMRNPHINKLFGLEREPGLSNILAGVDDWEKTVRPTDIENLWIIPSGLIPPNPAELISFEVTARIIDQLRGHYDRILIDSPPVLGVTDSVALSRLVDGVVVIAKVGVTTREMLGNCLTQLRDIKAKILGLVLNEVPIGRDSYYYSRYYHHYGYESGKDAPSPDQPS